MEPLYSWEEVRDSTKFYTKEYIVVSHHHAVNCSVKPTLNMNNDNSICLVKHNLTTAFFVHSKV